MKQHRGVPLANEYTKHFGVSTRKGVLGQVYDSVAAGSNWTIADEIGGYDSGAQADGDCFVIECAGPWADADVHQQILFAANDSTSAKTFGGSGGTKWTVAAKSIAVIYAPHGGWSVANKDFSNVVGTLPEIQRVLTNSTSATPGYDLNLVLTVDEFMLFGQEAGVNVGLFAGQILSQDTSANDPRPCAIIIGLLTLTAATAGGWASVAASAAAVPNVAGTGWMTACTESNGAKIDTYSATKIAGAYVELPLGVYAISVPKFAGTFKSMRRVSTTLSAGDISAAGDRIAYAGVTFPWEV